VPVFHEWRRRRLHPAFVPHADVAWPFTRFNAEDGGDGYSKGPRHSPVKIYSEARAERRVSHRPPPHPRAGNALGTISDSEKSRPADGRQADGGLSSGFRSSVFWPAGSRSKPGSRPFIDKCATSTAMSCSRDREGEYGWKITSSLTAVPHPKLHIDRAEDDQQGGRSRRRFQRHRIRTRPGRQLASRLCRRRVLIKWIAPILAQPRATRTCRRKSTSTRASAMCSR